METGLSDADPRIVLIALKLYARSFRGALMHTTGEIVSSLCQQIDLKFEEEISPFTDGLDTSDPSLMVILKKVFIFITRSLNLASFDY